MFEKRGSGVHWKVPSSEFAGNQEAESVTDVELRVLDTGDSRRFEVVVDGLPLHGGVQLALDINVGVMCPRRWGAQKGSRRH